jgi:hypothetical protein
VTASSRVDLYWLPLGAGGWFVRFNGRVYERILARREHRTPLALYHTGLEVTIPVGRYVIENAWPIPDSYPEARGVTVQGPVWASALGRFRIFRYEVRRWRDGSIPDVAEAVASPQLVSTDDDDARAVLRLVELVPRYVWGRREPETGEMWNSNSVISWLLASAELPADDIRPPEGGRAPGWTAGVVVARRIMEKNNARILAPECGLRDRPPSAQRLRG